MQAHREDSGPDTQGAPQKLLELRAVSDHPPAGLPAREDIPWGIQSGSHVLCLGGTWKCRHVGNLFSSHNYSKSPGGSAGSCFNGCCPCRGANAEADVEACPPPMIFPPPSAPAEEPGPACAVTPHLTEDPSPLDAEPSPQPCPGSCLGGGTASRKGIRASSRPLC